MGPPPRTLPVTLSLSKRDGAFSRTVTLSLSKRDGAFSRTVTLSKRDGAHSSEMCPLYLPRETDAQVTRHHPGRWLARDIAAGRAHGVEQIVDVEPNGTIAR